MLEELVRANIALITTNAKFSASVASLIKSNEQLCRWVGNRQINQNNQNTQTREGPLPRPKTLCPHCKIAVMHAPDS